MKRKLPKFLAGLTLLEIGLANYFINYALVVNQGGGQRKVDKSQTISHQHLEKIAAEKAKADLKRKTWLSETQSQRQQVWIRSHEGLSLYGHLTRQAHYSRKWVLLVHGYQMNEEETQRLAPYFYEKNFNVLTICLRAHPPSQGKYIGMGYLDKDDIAAWTRYLVELDPDCQIVLHGTSMGAASVMMASALDLPHQVKAVIEDCGYSSIFKIFSLELKKRFGLPAFPLLDIADLLVRLRAHYSLKAGQVTRFIEKSSLPTLFIHGQVDDFVPVEMAYELYSKKKSGPKKLLIFPQADHAQAKFSDPKRYYESIFAFIDAHL